MCKDERALTYRAPWLGLRSVCGWCIRSKYKGINYVATDEGLQLRARVDCPKCLITFEVTWHDDSMSLEDMAEAPVADVTCPGCKHVMVDEPWPGWTFRSEAG